MSMSGQTACIACNISRYVHTIYMFELLCIMLFACLYYGFCAPHRIAWHRAGLSRIFCNFDTSQKCTLPAVAYVDAYQHGYCARCINVHVNFLSGACGRRLAKMQMAIMMAAAAGRAHFF